MGTVGWAQFRAEHLDAQVLSRVTESGRRYSDNPYVGYHDPDSEPLFALPRKPDYRLPVKARVVGVGEGDRAVAVSRDLLAETGLQHVTLGRDRVALWHVPVQRSALDTQMIPMVQRSVRSPPSPPVPRNGRWTSGGPRTTRSATGRRDRPGTCSVAPSAVRCAGRGWTRWSTWTRSGSPGFAFQPDTDLVAGP